MTDTLTAARGDLATARETIRRAMVEDDADLAAAAGLIDQALQTLPTIKLPGSPTSGLQGLRNLIASQEMGDDARLQLEADIAQLEAMGETDGTHIVMSGGDVMPFHIRVEMAVSKLEAAREHIATKHLEESAGMLDGALFSLCTHGPGAWITDGGLTTCNLCYVSWYTGETA